MKKLKFKIISFFLIILSITFCISIFNANTKEIIDKVNNENQDKIDVLIDEDLKSNKFYKIIDRYGVDNNPAYFELFNSDEALERLKSMNKSLNENFDYIEFGFQSLYSLGYYDKEKDVYICPDGYELKNVSKESTINKVYKNKEACKNCPNKDQCHKSPIGRRLHRNSNHEIYDKVNKITIDNIEIYKKRQQIVEHPFGTIKRTLGFTYFLTRGNQSVRAESFMHFFIYNFKRVINIIGVKELIEHLNTIIFYYTYEYFKNIKFMGQCW